MKLTKLFILIVVGLLFLVGCDIHNEFPQPTPSPNVQDELLPSMFSAPPSTLPNTTASGPTPTSTLLPNPTQLTDELHDILFDEEIIALSQSAITRGAVTQDGRLLIWGDLDTSAFSLYSVRGIENVYDTGLNDIVNAWLADSHIDHNFALDKTGQLWGFGSNARGLLLTEETWPKGAVPIMDHIISFTRGRRNSAWAAAVKDDGTVWFWGWPGDYDAQTRDYRIISPTQIASHATSVHYTVNDHLHMVTNEGHLFDLGSGENLFDGIIEERLIRENTLWADGGYALGNDKTLYFRGQDGNWQNIMADVKQVDCSQDTAFLLTEEGRLYIWDNQYFASDIGPNQTLEHYPWESAAPVQLLDNVVLAAPLLGGVTVYLNNGTITEVQLT